MVSSNHIALFFPLNDQGNSAPQESSFYLAWMKTQASLHLSTFPQSALNTQLE